LEAKPRVTEYGAPGHVMKRMPDVLGEGDLRAGEGG